MINRNAPLWELDAEEFSRVIDINIKGTANVIRHFVPAMVARKHGVIVNFSRAGGEALHRMSPRIAHRMGDRRIDPGIVTGTSARNGRGAPNPGIIDTEMLRSCFGGLAAGDPDAGKWVNRAGPTFSGCPPGRTGNR